MVAEGRGRRSVVAPEGLRELCRLAVANCAGDGLHGEGALPQQLGRAGHPDPLELSSEARGSDLREGALKLPPRGGDGPSHRLQ